MSPSPTCCKYCRSLPLSYLQKKSTYLDLSLPSSPLPSNTFAFCFGSFSFCLCLSRSCLLPRCLSFPLRSFSSLVLPWSCLSSLVLPRGFLPWGWFFGCGRCSCCCCWLWGWCHFLFFSCLILYANIFFSIFWSRQFTWNALYFLWEMIKQKQKKKSQNAVFYNSAWHSKG